MIVCGTKELAAPRETVWGVINEPSEMAKLMPGVESFEVTDEKHWTAKVKVPLGLGGLKMTMNFEKLEEREPEFASMRAKGQGVGALDGHDDLVHALRGGRRARRWRGRRTSRSPARSARWGSASSSRS